MRRRRDGPIRYVHHTLYVYAHHTGCFALYALPGGHASLATPAINTGDCPYNPACYVERFSEASDAFCAITTCTGAGDHTRHQLAGRFVSAGRNRCWRFR